LAEVFETNLSELATKEDLRHEIGDLCKDMDVKLVNLKFELLKWLVGIAIAQAGLLIGILKFFPINS
jgi:hypothetical protein